MATNDILHAIRPLEPEMIAIRHDIHAHPELGFKEVRTAALISGKLREWGIETHEGIAHTGVVGTIRGKRTGDRAIALRADMDALSILEKTGLPYASTDLGRMHACGHDGHTAMLLGAARHLAETRDFAGAVHLIFQPAEEGLGGARLMLEEGLFERFPTDAVYGMHNEPGRRAGEFGIRSGAMLAASDTWTVTFGGTGGHGGAAPHLATDPTVVTAHFVLAIQTIIGRNIPAMEPAVISVGHLSAGSSDAPNVIPSQVLLTGTARSYSKQVRDTIERRLRETAEGLASTHGCTATVYYQRRYPPLVNHGEQTAKAVKAAARVVGSEKVEMDIPPITSAEDFSFMLEKRPGAMIMIGNGTAPDGTFHYVHTPYYDFNDRILATGAAYWVALVKEELAQ